MSTPPLLLGAGFLFWGWLSGLGAVALVGALLLEAPRWTRFRLDLTGDDLRKVTALTYLIAAGVLLWLWVQQGFPGALVRALQWIPLALGPLVLAQGFGTLGRTPVASLGLGRARPAGEVDLAYPFWLACILSASIINQRSPVFYAALVLLGVWALWPMRPRRYPVFLWLGMLVAAAGLGYVGHLGLSGLQQKVESTALAFLSGDGERTDPYRAATDIGHIGELKQSDRILLRVTTDRPAPILLHRATYDRYASPSWYARDARFAPVEAADRARTRWVLASGPTAPRRLTVSRVLRREEAVLALPHGTTEVAGLEAIRMARNRLGAVKVTADPGLVRYAPRFNPARGAEGVPGETDLTVPPRERPALSRLVTRLGLDGLAPAAQITRVERYFEESFEYATYGRDRKVGGTPITDFLEHSREGHCEYFATATVLLLRAAGLPARYATGFSVQEPAGGANHYVVRQRHAHAWARVWRDGGWHTVDTTPAAWAAVEAEGASLFEPLKDLWSWLEYRWSEWRASDAKRWRRELWLILIVLAGAVAWRLRARVARSSNGSRPDAVPAVGPRPGIDSAFYAIEARLAARGLPRGPDQSLRDWLAALEAADADALDLAGLGELLAIHYRYRFDPAGISPGERAAFSERVEAWLSGHD